MASSLLKDIRTIPNLITLSRIAFLAIASSVGFAGGFVLGWFSALGYTRSLVTGYEGAALVPASGV